MPLQNRVTPEGEIVATPHRGLMMGNRGGCFHLPDRTLGARRWATRQWIACVLEFKGRRRQLMQPHRYTELFFLDEATALAAGHRPCFFCRRRAAEAFRSAWMIGNGGDRPSAPAMDEVLHGERLANRRKRLHGLPAPVDRLPDGAMVASGSACYVIAGGRALEWTEEGYRQRADALSAAALLTPPSTVRALAAGYRAILHPTATAPVIS